MTDPLAVSASARGFTLVELVITIAVLSVALLGVAYSLQYSAQHGADSLWQTKTVELAQAYSDEILTKRFDEQSPVGGIPACGSSASAAACSAILGPEAGEQRGAGVNSYDDVDDYHGLDEMPPVDALGAVRSGYAGYRVEVRVSYAGSDLGLGSNLQAKQIRILVTPPLTPATAVPFSVYRGNY